MTHQPRRIEKFRVVHDLQNQFDLPDAIKIALEGQLSIEEQNQLRRFVAGFRIEDWFEWTFSSIPWVVLIHGLDQQQFPSRSKEIYQVPDFLVLVENSTLKHQPLFVEVKRIAPQKESLKLQHAQLELCRNYANAVGIPLVFAIYWEKFNCWSLNTPDSFTRSSSTSKLPMTAAFELDCGLILGDVSYLMPLSLIRVSRFSKNTVSTGSAVRHKEFGTLASDVAVIGDNRVEMTSVESAAIDSMITLTTRNLEAFDNGETELVQSPTDNHVLKLSSWITRHLAMFGVDPSEQLANVSANVIADLMNKLGSPPLHLFPSNATKDLASLANLFFAVEQNDASEG